MCDGSDSLKTPCAASVGGESPVTGGIQEDMDGSD